MPDPLMVFEMPVAVWVNGVIAFFALLIVYLVIWCVFCQRHTYAAPPSGAPSTCDTSGSRSDSRFVFRVIHYDSGFTTALADALAMIVFTLGGVATTAGLTGENVFRLNCRAQPMWPDVLALCLYVTHQQHAARPTDISPAAIGAAIAWAQIGLVCIWHAFHVRADSSASLHFDLHCHNDAGLP